MTALAKSAERIPMSVIRLMAGEAVFWQCYLLHDFLDVARMAIEAGMRAGEREFGLSVMIKPPKFPTVRIVADRALVSQATFVVIGFPVARGTEEGCILESLRQMAFFARHDGMLADKRKARDIVIERNVAAPAIFSVTLSAQFPKLAFMWVIVTVAPAALHREFLFEKITYMTPIAFRLLVFAAQGKLRILVVIETNSFPFLGRMAFFAFFSTRALMNILQAVAADAGRWYILIPLCRMAGFARNLLMLSVKREFGLVMVERFCGFPAILAMARFAFLSQSALMGLIILVAFNASRGRLAKFHFRFVAFVA